MARGGAKYVVIAVDYFTKWVKAEPMATITSAKVIKIEVKNIIFDMVFPIRLLSITERSLRALTSITFMPTMGLQRDSWLWYIPKRIDRLKQLTRS